MSKIDRMARKDKPYLPLYVQDFLTDEKLMECSAASTGVYIRLMCIMHKNDPYGTVLLKQKDKQSDDQINNFALKIAKHLPYGVLEIKMAIQELLSEEVLQINGDTLIQKRMFNDGDLSLKRSESGSEGGRTTQAKNKIFAKAKSKANSDIESDIENEDDVLELNVPFETFWDLYDKKTSPKDKCEKKWVALKDHERESAMAHIPEYKISQPQKRFRKDPATFLNNKSWENEIIDYNGTTPIKNLNGNSGTKLGTSAARIEVAKNW